MAIFYPPPPPFLGARQPHAPRQLAPAIAAVPADNPPTMLGGPVALRASIVAANQPDWSTKAWPYLFIGRSQPYEPDKIGPGTPGQSIDRPPTSLGGPLALKHELAWLSQPDPWTFNYAGGRAPFEPRKLSPGTPGQSIDRPPTMLGGPVALLASIVAANQPDWSTKAWPYVFIGRCQPYEPGKLSPAIPGQSIDKPPFTYGGPLALKHELAWLSQPDPWTFNYAGGRAPFEPRKLSAGTPGQSIDNPPTSLGGPVALPASIIAANQPEWSTKAWPYVFIGRTQPYAPRVASPRLNSVVVDNPPFSSFGRTPAMAAIAQAWVPPFPTFQVTLYASRPTPQRLRPTARGYVIL